LGKGRRRGVELGEEEGREGEGPPESCVSM
jgi:hypothetical protein